MPALGFILKGQKTGQRVVFALICFMTMGGLLGAAEWGLTIVSVETYRGHAKGFHFYFNEALAIALLISLWLEKNPDFRWLPKWIGFYYLYCFLSVLSILNAPVKLYTLMTFHKMMMASILFIAVYNYIRDEEDLAYFLKVMACSMIWQLIVVLKMKYLQGMYQVKGTFEHQNPLSMYTTMIGMVLLSAGLGPGFKGSNLMIVAFLACGAIVQSTLSRAGMVIMAGGVAATMMLSILEKPTKRRILAVGGLAVMGGIGLLLTLDTIISRFNDKGNTASSELRHVLNAACRAMVQDHPLGIGWNNYALTINAPYPYAEIVYEWIRGRGMKVDESKANAVVESHYYLLLAETGYQGIGSYLIIITISLWRNLRAFWYFKHGLIRCVSLGIGIGCLLNYAQSTLERVLVQPRNLMLWLILMAITAKIEFWRRKRRNNSNVYNFNSGTKL